MTKTKSPPAFETILRSQGAKIGLFTTSEIARYLDYKERNFQNRIAKQSFTIPELIKIFRMLHFSDENIIDFFGGQKRNAYKN
jgi:hypothetical protein